MSFAALQAVSHQCMKQATRKQGSCEALVAYTKIRFTMTEIGAHPGPDNGSERDQWPLIPRISMAPTKIAMKTNGIRFSVKLDISYLQVLGTGYRALQKSCITWNPSGRRSNPPTALHPRNRLEHQLHRPHSQHTISSIIMPVVPLLTILATRGIRSWHGAVFVHTWHGSCCKSGAVERATGRQKCGLRPSRLREVLR